MASVSYQQIVGAGMVLNLESRGTVRAVSKGKAISPGSAEG
jgi:hypothetical protein